MGGSLAQAPLRRARLPTTLAPVSDEVELRIAWAAIAPAGRRSQEVFDDLVRRHRQPHRRYHGLRHVVWVLRHARRLEAEIAEVAECGRRSPEYDGAAVTAAAWFHDAVYDPRAADNEARSAGLATEQLSSLGWPADRCRLVAELVEATAGHISDDVTVASEHALERDVLLDADLGVLGADPAAYAAYVSGVRGEYGFLAADEWAAGRGDVLRGLLGRRALYRTAPARSWWEARARANLTAELAALAAS
jgi:predicted metal-dependent HD superfamily phosphohydrolase